VVNIKLGPKLSNFSQTKEKKQQKNVNEQRKSKKIPTKQDFPWRGWSENLGFIASFPEVQGTFRQSAS